MILIAKVKMVKIWIVHVIKNPQCWIFLAKSKVYESFDSWYRKSQDLYVMKKNPYFYCKIEICTHALKTLEFPKLALR